MLILAAAILSALAGAPTIPLTGTTVDPDGKPVAGVDLWLVGNAVPGEAPIVASGRSDDRGRFALVRPAALVGGEGNLHPVTLWGHWPGRRIASREFRGELPGPDRPIRLEIGRPARTEIRVVDPDDNPVAGARVRVGYLREFHSLPRPLADQLEPVTDSRGKAVLDGVAPVELGSVAIRAEGFGTQPRSFYPPSDGAKTVRLRPAARVSGRLIADDPLAVRGWRISASTTPSDGGNDRDGYWIGEAEAVADDDGRFRIPAIAAGSLSLSCEPPDGVTYRAKRPRAWPVLRTDVDNAVEVPVLRAVRVSGVVRERTVGAPIAGVRLNVYSFADGNRFPVTDAQGRFTAYALPADLTVRVIDAPPPYVATPGAGRLAVTVPDGADHLDLEPVDLVRRGPPLRGMVLDEAGRPVADAVVTGAWKLAREADAGIVTSTAMTDDRGSFRIADVAPGAQVKVFARRRDLAMDGPVNARVGLDDFLTLRLSRRATASIRGRILRKDGRPVPDARIHVYFQTHVDCIGGVAGTFWFGAPGECRTGADGSFQTPHELLRIAEYRVEAMADGFVTGARDEWVDLEPGDVTAVPDLVLKAATRLRAVSGRVVDRRGAPIAGADVVQSGDGPARTKARTDAQGRFRLRGVAEAPAFLAAEKAGYRLGGRTIGPGDEPVELVLDRTDEAPRAIRKTLPWPTPRAEERAIGRRLLEPVLAATRERDPGHLQEPALAAMARVDPDRVLEMLENRVIAQGRGLINAAALGTLEDSPGEASKVVESDRDPASRIEGDLALFHGAAASQRDFRRTLLERALAESRRVEDPAVKVTLLAQVGDGWLELGDRDRAAPILRNARALHSRLIQMRNHSLILGLAPPLALVDLPSAVAIAEGRDSVPFQRDPVIVNRELGEIAGRIAGIHPDEAGRLLDRINAPVANNRDESILRTCRGMAAVDLGRAWNIAATRLRRRIHPQGDDRPTLELYARLAMADALAGSDPAAARGILRETIAQLRRLAVEGAGRIEDPQPAGLIAGCLPLVERIDPDRLDQCLAAAIASRPPLPDEPDVGLLRTLATLAALVARYDPAAAEVIARPVFEDAADLAVPPFRRGNAWDLATVLATLAGVDPRRAADLVERLPDDHEFTDGRFKTHPGMRPMWNDAKSRARVAVARMLGLPIDGRRREIGKQVHDPWLIGESP